MILNSKDCTLDVESSRGDENTQKIDLIKVLTQSSIHVIALKK